MQTPGGEEGVRSCTSSNGEGGSRCRWCDDAHGSSASSDDGRSSGEQGDPRELDLVRSAAQAMVSVFTSHPLAPFGSPTVSVFSPPQTCTGAEKRTLLRMHQQALLALSSPTASISPRPLASLPRSPQRQQGCTGRHAQANRCHGRMPAISKRPSRAQRRTRGERGPPSRLRESASGSWYEIESDQEQTLCPARTRRSSEAPRTLSAFERNADSSIWGDSWAARPCLPQACRSCGDSPCSSAAARAQLLEGPSAASSSAAELFMSCSRCGYSHSEGNASGPSGSDSPACSPSCSTSVTETARGAGTGLNARNSGDEEGNLRPSRGRVSPVQSGRRRPATDRAPRARSPRPAPRPRSRGRARPDWVTPTQEVDAEYATPCETPLDADCAGGPAAATNLINISSVTSFPGSLESRPEAETLVSERCPVHSRVESLRGDGRHTGSTPAAEKAIAPKSPATARTKIERTQPMERNPSFSGTLAPANTAPPRQGSPAPPMALQIAPPALHLEP
ncbi:hypothetical protein BESB_046280 [Besnoitia besnoiti]|uniref:Uncharacterized protein n=1 Tax=Besnoitia besnoiti TaxID=94643 RepID=A0A2A9MKD0_BESBE|nr:hypothetical protein BESB_046280 [Besnoitia besnoiti]PFH36436.1 hypothetical protein BESB_046280 [Besnoitia besnoiti]